MLILNAAEVAKALPMPSAVDAMKNAFIAITDGSANLPLRTHIDVAAHNGTTLVMPAHVASKKLEALTIKVVSVFGDNPASHELARIQAAVIVLDPQTGQPIALLEGSTLTGIRTAAASGAATDVLARPDCKTLAILGAGVQARTHLDAMLAVRPIEKVAIWSRTPQKVQSLVDELNNQGRSCEIIAAPDACSAVKDADIVCTVTTAREPIFAPSDIRPGTHLNVVGSYQPHVREVPGETVAAAEVFVDEVESALSEAGDLIQPINDGLITKEHIRGAIGDVLTERIPGRTNDEQITLFKSVGNAAEDAMAAAQVMHNANQFDLGTAFAF